MLIIEKIKNKQRGQFNNTAIEIAAVYWNRSFTHQIHRTTLSVQPDYVNFRQLGKILEVFEKF